jgi:polyisoprenoid-binding protein YceI
MATTKWQLDVGHTAIAFKIKHLAIANVTGAFKSFSGELLSTDETDFNGAEVQFSIDVTSIDTNNAQRDEHLRSDIFFNAAQFPNMSFKGKLIQDGDDYQLQGDMTILSTTKPVVFDVAHTGIGTGRFNDTRAGFEVSGKIKRKDFGLSFHMLNDAGDALVGEEVKVSGDIEFVKQ